MTKRQKWTNDEKMLLFIKVYDKLQQIGFENYKELQSGDMTKRNSKRHKHEIIDSLYEQNLLTYRSRQSIGCQITRTVFEIVENSSNFRCGLEETHRKFDQMLHRDKNMTK